jgi:hypothetical protein
MRIPNDTVTIENRYQRHPSEFEQVDLLAVHEGNPMFRVWQSHKRKSFDPPVQTESCRSIRTDHNDLRIPFHELLIVVPQARQLRAAVRSKKSAEKGQ